MQQIDRLRRVTSSTAFYILFVVLFTLFAFEILLRVFKRNQSWSESVGHGYVSGYNWVRDSRLFTWPADTSFEVNQGEFKYQYKTNRWGIREREVPFTDSCSSRVICLGDSYTEGLGTAYDSSYPRVLERQFLYSKLKGFEVYNAGVAGSDPFYEYEFLREKLLETEPDFVLITFNSSDLTDYIFRGGLERFRSDGKTHYNKGPWFEGMYARSYLCRFICNKVLGYEQNLFVRKKDIPSKYSQAVTAYTNLFNYLNTLCKLNGAQAMVLIQPIAEEVVKDNLHNQQILNAFGEIETKLHEKNIPCVNLAPYLQKSLTTENYLSYAYKNDAHYNGMGYKLLGENVYRAILVQYPHFFKKQ